MATRAWCRFTLAAVGIGALLGLTGAACPDLSTPPTPDAGPEPGNSGVLALAGADLAVLEGSRVQLAGEGSRSLAGTARLSWSQVAGAPVLLTNPSSTLPSFVAPLAPAVLAFELRAESDGETGVDRVTVVVGTEPGDGPAFVLLPADEVAAPGTTQSFSVGIAGTPTGAVTLVASACRGGSAAVEGTTVTVTLPDTLPCAIVVDGVDENGRGVAPASRVFWPADTALPIATRLSASPFPPAGGTAALSFAPDAASRAVAWAADGVMDGLAGLVDGDQVAFTVPRRRARLAFAGEERRGNASGAVRIAFVEVTDGAGNVAPRASGGNDRIVQPRARFRIDTGGSFDLDGDALTLRATQVLGDAATPQAATGAFLAPASEGTLLFHVVADDGTVESPPDTVRVVVSVDAVNLRPVVPVAPRRFVAPGQVFTIDGHVAEDPDSGVLSSVVIRQLEDDAVVLLSDPVELVATLVAGEAGDVYHFEVTAFDEQGLGGSALQEVVVEEAGPYVDPVRGDDVIGTGTAAAPFQTVAGALATAIDHELDELLLAEGSYAPASVSLPTGLSLRGAWHFDGAAYVSGGAESLLPLVGEGVSVSDGKLAQLHLRLDDASASVRLAGAAAIEQCEIEKATSVPGGVLAVGARANAVLEGCSVRSALAAGGDDATVSVAADAALRVVGGSIASGDGAVATAVRCDHGTLSVEAATVAGGGQADEARAIDAQRCNVELVGATVLGGAGLSVVGLAATSSVVTIDATSLVTGATGASDAAVAVLLGGTSGSALLGGQLRATAEGVDTAMATVVACVGGALALADATLVAGGEGARGVVLDATSMSAADSAITLVGDDTVAIDVAEVGELLLERVDVRAARGIEGVATFVALTDSVIEGTDAGCLVPDASVAVTRGSLSADSDGATAVLVARAASLQDTRITARGASAEGARLGTGASTVERSTVDVEGSSGSGITHTGPLLLRSSFLTVSGVPALRSTGAATLVNASIVADGDGIAVEAGGSLVITSSAIFGEPSIRALGVPPWLSASALAFDDVGSLLVVGAEQVTTGQRLAELGCADCLIVPATLIDETGHLRAGANALVDAGDTGDSAADDIDREPRPQGAAPDIGCDERP